MQMGKGRLGRQSGFPGTVPLASRDVPEQVHTTAPHGDFLRPEFCKALGQAVPITFAVGNCLHHDAANAYTEKSHTRGKNREGHERDPRLEYMARPFRSGPCRLTASPERRPLSPQKSPAAPVSDAASTNSPDPGLTRACQREDAGEGCGGLR